MAAALFAGAAFGGGRASVTYSRSTRRWHLGLRSRAAAAQPGRRSNNFDLYKSLGTGLLRVAAVAERCWESCAGILSGILFVACWTSHIFGPLSRATTATRTATAARIRAGPNGSASSGATTRPSARARRSARTTASTSAGRTTRRRRGPWPRRRAAATTRRRTSPPKTRTGGSRARRRSAAATPRE